MHRNVRYGQSLDGLVQTFHLSAENAERDLEISSTLHRSNTCAASAEVLADAASIMSTLDSLMNHPAGGP